ncbi:hypothetical protein [Bosea sp. 117]|uniref:hypothetical protein n=1 Tax=Bosea sp. 117 TaxID=1125973 RepID=UPI0012DD42C9|nr:hypothetical protein [Bosea sp. 117]
MNRNADVLVSGVGNSESEHAEDHGADKGEGGADRQHVEFVSDTHGDRLLIAQHEMKRNSL